MYLAMAAVANERCVVAEYVFPILYLLWTINQQRGSHHGNSIVCWFSFWSDRPTGFGGRDGRLVVVSIRK
jgi:hypothetical protein